MKKKGLSFNYIILTLICQFFLCFLVGNGQVFAKSTDNFYFESFEADYYISKDSEGYADMRVVEEFTAVFPERQNKGICRKIAYLGSDSQAKIKNMKKSDVKVTRNGKSEPIYSFEKDSGAKVYTVCTGTDEYVEGTQVYTFEYNYHSVATEYMKSGKTWQEIYWNTNGTGWPQKFNKLTARVHFSDPSVMTGDTSCYVGSRGEKGAERCVTTKISDGFEFTTYNLASRENLTYDIELKKGSFAIAAPEENYIMIVAVIGTAIICGLLLISPIKKYKKTAEKREYYKNYFVVPQYTPAKGYSLVEMAKIHISTKNKDSKVAVLLDMIVNEKIEIVEDGKGVFGKQKWAIIPKISKDEMLDYERNIITILNGGEDFTVDQKIELKRRMANSTTVALGLLYEESGKKAAKMHGLVEKDSKNAISTATITAIVFWSVVLPIFLPILSMAFESDELYTTDEGVILVGFSACVIAIVAIVGITFAIYVSLAKKYQKVINHTLKGIEMSVYMDGLKLYITMAEKDRLKFLQSVETAPRDEAGIVKLNEKLLPYAALFGVEESWMKELAKYYELNEGTTCPTWYHTVNSYGVSNFSTTIRSASSYASSGSTYGGGSGGGGGGGHSGGGGGGGGGGGR